MASVRHRRLFPASPAGDSYTSMMPQDSTSTNPLLPVSNSQSSAKRLNPSGLPPPPEWVQYGSKGALLVACLLMGVLLGRESSAPVVSVPSTVAATTSHNQRSLLQASPSLDPTPPLDHIYDVAVVGAGPAGLSAALFCARSNLAVLVLGSSAGGLLAEATSLENFPSYTTGGSLNWLQQTKQQAIKWGATQADPTWMVTSLEVAQAVDGNAQDESSIRPFALRTNDVNQTVHHAWSVIVATGATPRRLGLDHEEELWGKGIHSCAVCDGSAYGPTDTVMVVGGGDAAVAAALYLARRVKKVVFVHRKADLKRPQNRGAVTALYERSLEENTESGDARKDRNIEIVTPYHVTEWHIAKDKETQAVRLVGATLDREGENGRTTQSRDIECQGAFLMIGADPNTDWLPKNIDRRENSKSIQLVSSETGTQATSIPGVFAAGEVSDDGAYRQAITAAAQGAQAGMDSERWLGQFQLGRVRVQESNSNSNTDPAEVAQDRQRRSVRQAQLWKEQEQELKSRLAKARKKEKCHLTEQACILELVRKVPVVVLSKPTCPFCMKALESLFSEGIHEAKHIKIVDLADYGRTESHKVVTAFKSITGSHTVPQVFIGGEYIGGGDDTAAMHRTGALKEKLAAAGISPG